MAITLRPDVNGRRLLTLVFTESHPFSVQTTAS